MKATLCLLLLGFSTSAWAAPANPSANDFYERLGVSQSASESEVKKAFIAAMKTYHPDRGGSTVDAQRINEAYDALRSKPKPQINPERSSTAGSPGRQSGDSSSSSGSSYEQQYASGLEMAFERMAHHMNANETIFRVVRRSHDPQASGLDSGALFLTFFSSFLTVRTEMSEISQFLKKDFALFAAQLILKQTLVNEDPQTIQFVEKSFMSSLIHHRILESLILNSATDAQRAFVVKAIEAAPFSHAVSNAELVRIAGQMMDQGFGSPENEKIFGPTMAKVLHQSLNRQSLLETGHEGRKILGKYWVKYIASETRAGQAWSRVKNATGGFCSKIWK